MIQKTSPSLTAQLLQDPLHPFPCYHLLRTERPAYYAPEFKSWFISRYDDVQCIINDPDLFSSQQTFRRRRPLSDTGNTARTLLWADPPHHKQLRSLVSQAFTPRTISGLATRITQITHTHLDLVARKGLMDVIHDLANPLPIIVIAELLGIPARDQQQFKSWSDSIVSPVRLPKKQAVIAMNNYFLTIIEQRRQQPEDDLISALLHAQIDGVSLSDADLLNFCRLLLVAGHETSTNLIGNALLTFDEYPAVMDELRSNPALIPAAIEEVIRYRTPIQRLRRAATSDTIIHGQHIKAGAIVSPILGSANRDEKYFSQPDTFDIHRTPNRHIGFGHGIHFCIGAPLARLETKIALEALLTRFIEIQRVKDIPLQPVASSFVYGVKSLPVTFREVL